jgi:hypothetical protein
MTTPDSAAVTLNLIPVELEQVQGSILPYAH